MLSTKKTTQTASNPRIKVELKTLIDLATPARLLKQAKSAIKSQHNGGFVSRVKGRGMEFDETRLYQAGDDIRSIDWRVSARTGKTYTKLYREERERAVFISVDYSPTMQFATRGVFKAVQAAKLAALLAWRAQHHGDRIGGQVFSSQHCLELKPHNGKQSVLRFFHALVADMPEQIIAYPLETIISRLNQHVKPGSLVYLISDFRGLNTACEAHLARLTQHCDVVLIQVLDPLETHLPKTGRYQLTNGEQQLSLDTNETQRATNYQQRFQRRQAELQAVVKKLRLGYLQCLTTDKPLDILR